MKLPCNWVRTNKNLLPLAFVAPAATQSEVRWASTAMGLSAALTAWIFACAVPQPTWLSVSLCSLAGAPSASCPAGASRLAPRGCFCHQPLLAWARRAPGAAFLWRSSSSPDGRCSPALVLSASRPRQPAALPQGSTVPFRVSPPGLSCIATGGCACGERGAAWAQLGHGVGVGVAWRGVAWRGVA